MKTKTFGGDDRNRTDDLLHAMQTLYQLSYAPEKLGFSESFFFISVNPKKTISF